MQSFNLGNIHLTRIILLNLFFLLLAGVCFSQNTNQAQDQAFEKNYRDFRNVFDNEIERVRQQHGGTRPRAFPDIPEALPGWLFNIPAACNEYIYLFGISDPGMDNENGLKLAIHRAWLVYMLTEEVQFANMRDYYSRETDRIFSQTYLEFSELMASSHVHPNQYELIKKHITRFDETIVLLRVAKLDPQTYRTIELPKLKLTASLFTQFKLYDQAMQTDEKLHIEFFFDSEEGPVQLDHHYVKINQITNSRTLENNILVSDLPSLRLRYRNTDGNNQISADNDSIVPYGKCLNNGLWHAWVSGFLHELADFCHQGSIHFSNISDIYQQLSQSLSREYANKRLHKPLPGMYIVDNKLILNF